jgi:hypothetical protein
MKRLSPASSAILHCVVSALGFAGSYAGYRLWFVAGGWERRTHWGEGTLWAVSAIIGVWGAVDAVRLGRKAEPSVTVYLVRMVGAILVFSNGLAFLFFLFFLRLLADGGPGGR